jgi:hypothetical protein
MGRPRLPESEKLRSFPVRLAPKSTGRLLTLCARADGRPAQELLRDILVPAVERLYERTLKQGHDLPDVAKVAMMSDSQFNLLLGNRGKPKPGRPKLTRLPVRRPGPRLKRPERAHATA